ncbi:MAG TPA: hypothetical protein VD837_01155 [Terriglobales bacterium]|nr:hypothetical protein [Terriglobales bacterium]
MALFSRITCTTGLVLLIAAVAAAASPGKVEKIGHFADASPEQMKTALAASGYRLTLYDGSVMELWLSNSLPAAKEKDPNAVYPQISRATFIGVIKFQRQAKDFRGQAIRPGAYTMRYEILPSDGNHMGVAAQPDFVLLTPLAADPGPDALPSYAELVKLSAKAAGTAHPASFSMVPTEGATEYPSLFYTSDGYVAFAAQVRTASGELPIAIVVKGVAQQ